MLKKYVRYVSQSVIGMIGISIYILADTFFISVAAGTDGLAVLNLILPIYGIMFAIGAMIGIGSATGYSLKRAAHQTTNFCFMQSILWSLLISLIFVIPGIFCPEKILALMGADDTLILLGTSYLRTILIAAPCFMCNYTFTAFVRNDEKPVIAMTASIAGSFFNILFDYLLMFPMGLGFIGAAIATSLSPVVTILICLLHFFSNNNHIGLKLKTPSLHHLIKACSLGAPAFVGELTAAVTTITFNLLILSMAGNAGVAAYGVVANIALVIMALFNGISQGSQPLFSSSYGSGNKNEARELLKMSMITAISAMTIVLGIIFFKTDGIIQVFNQEANMELYQYAYTGLHLYFLGFIFASVNIVLITYFAEVGRTGISMVGSIMRGFVGIVFWAVILSWLFGMKGIWTSFLASEITTFMIICGMLLSH